MDQHEFQTAVFERFTSVDRAIEATNSRIDLIEKRVQIIEFHIKGLSEQMNTMQLQMGIMVSQLNEIYQSRDRVKIRFGREWVAASFAIAVVASGITFGFGRI